MIEGKFAKIAITNPVAAPYGAAAVETMKSLKLYDTLQPKFVEGANITQAFQFVDTGNAELGFVALSQLAGNTGGSRWLVPQNLYKPIRQDAVLLKKGAGNGGDRVHRLPQGTRRRARSSRSTATCTTPTSRRGRDCRPTSATSIRLTIELAAITTIILLDRRDRRSPGGSRARAPAGRSPSRRSWRCRSCCRRPSSASTSSSPSARTDRAASSPGSGARRTLAFTFEGLVIGSVVYSMPFVVQPIRNAFEAMGERPLEVAATLRASPARTLLAVAVPLARPGFMTGAVLGFAHTVGEFGVVLMIGGNIPGETKVLSVAIYDFVETSALVRGEHPRGRHGRLRLCRHPRDDADREARCAGRRMSADETIRAAFRGALGQFELDVAFSVPASGVTGLFGPSGCGKTTVLRCIAGLQRLVTALGDRRRRLAGRNDRSDRRIERPIGYVFQEASLFAHLSVRRNLLFGAPEEARGGQGSGSASTRCRSPRVAEASRRGRRAISPAASASASPSAGRCFRSRNCS